MKAFSIEKPTGTSLPLIFDSPHSGNIYPDDFNYACDFKALQMAEDHYVEDLFGHVTDHGAHFLYAHFPRSYIDPNRAKDDIDPALLKEKWSGPFPINPSSRAEAGIGLIRRLVKPGIPVYNRALSEGEVLQRLEQYYHPYHNALETLINKTHYNFGQVWHINCHSMPSSSAHPRTAIGLAGGRSKAVDFVLGDRDGTSCSTVFTRALKNFIKGMGYTVSINDPFKGVEILERHAAPARGIHSLQLEINKSLYMDEKTGKKKEGYEHFKTDIQKLTNFIADYAESQLTDLAAD